MSNYCKECYKKQEQIEQLQAENERLKEELRTEKIYSSQIEELEESLQHERAENKELKEYKTSKENSYQNLQKEWQQLQWDVRKLTTENERLKEENYQLQKDCQICENFIDFIPCKPIRDMDYDLQKVISQRDNYYQALQEIRNIVSEPCIVDENCQTCNSGCMQKDIITKINEVIGAE